MNKKNKINRITCPFCSELILPTAKKCRFCGEWLNKKNKNNKKEITTKKLFLSWVLSLVLFYFILFLVDSDFSNKPFIWVALLGIDITFGIGFFLLLVTYLLKGLFNKKTLIKSIKYLSVVIILFISFFFILFNSDQTNYKSSNKINALGPKEVIAKINKTREIRGFNTVSENESLNKTAKKIANELCEGESWSLKDDIDYYKNLANEFGYKNNGIGIIYVEGIYDYDDLISTWLSSENTKELLLENSIEDAGAGIVRCGVKSLNKNTDVIVSVFSTQSNNFNKSNSINQKTNPNTPVHCEIHPNCGGGTTPLTREECDNSTCCEIKPGEWIFMKDKNNCNNNSNSANSQNSGNKVAFTTTEAIVDGTYYCYENRVNELTRMESDIKILQTTADICNDSSQFEADNCIEINCKNQGLDFSIDEYSLCLDDCYNNSTDCLSKNEAVGDKRREYMNLIYQVCP